jgi:Flp pilus assembly protein TadD
MSQHIQTALCLIIVLTAQLPAADDTVEQKLNVARNLFNAEAYSEAVTVLDGIVNNTTATVKYKATAYGIRGDANVRIGKQKDAYSDYASAITHQEKVTDGNEFLVNLLSARASLADSFGEFKVSASCLSRAAELAPDNAVMANNLRGFWQPAQTNRFTMASSRFIMQHVIAH